MNTKEIMEALIGDMEATLKNLVPYLPPVNSKYIPMKDVASIQQSINNLKQWLSEGEMIMMEFKNG